MGVASTQLCERARCWASLRADGELSELESALLDAHLGRCDACRSFARGAQEVAAALRAARLERPAPLAPLPRPRSGLAWRAVEAAAIVVAVAAAAVVATVGRPASSSALKPVAMVAAADSPDLLRSLRRDALVRNREGGSRSV